MTPRLFTLEILLIGGLLTTDRNYVSMWVRKARHDQEIARHSRSRSIGRLRCSLRRRRRAPGRLGVSADNFRVGAGTGPGTM